MTGACARTGEEAAGTAVPASRPMPFLGQDGTWMAP